jgi:hypothetical protein
MSAPRKGSVTGTWEQFTARTTKGQVFRFEVPTMDCCRNSRVRTYLAIPMAKYTIKQNNLLGELLEGSIVWVGQRVDEHEKIRRKSARMIADGERVFGKELPWYNQD